MFTLHHVSHVTCQVPGVRCQVSHVMCHMSLTPTTTATDLLFVNANSIVRQSKFRSASMQIPSCVHANSVVRPCKFRRASMQMNGKNKTNKKSAWQFLNFSEQKLLNLRPRSFLNFSLRILLQLVDWTFNLCKWE